MNFKKLTAAVMSATMLLSAPFTAYAETGEQTEVTESSKQGVPVTISVSNGETVVNDEVSTVADTSYDVSVSGKLNIGHYLHVEPASSVELTCADNDVKLISSVSQKRTVFESEELAVLDQVETTGTISKVSRSDGGELSELSGDYDGTLAFNIAVTEETAGLYSGDELLVNYSTLVTNYGLDLEADYTEDTYADYTEPVVAKEESIFEKLGLVETVYADALIHNSLYAVLQNNSELSSVTKIVIPDTITQIGAYSMVDCDTLSDVEIPDSVTSIGNNAFYNCSSLTSVTIPNSITSIGRGAFSGCSSLTSVTIPNSVTSIGNGAFRNALNIIYNGSATGSPWGAKCVNGYIDGDFVYADSTKTTLCVYAGNETDVTIPNSVTSIGEGAFYNCASLTSVTIPNSVTSIDYYAFSRCSSLTSVTIPNSVTSIGGDAFNYVPNIIYNGSATGSPWGAKCVNGYVDGDFVYADSTKTTLCVYAGNETDVTIPDGVTSIGNNAFRGCTGLKSVTIPNSVTSIGNSAFRNVPNIIYNGSATGSPWGAKCVNGYVDGDFVYADSTKTTLCVYAGNETDVTIPDGVTSIGEGAFAECKYITSVTIPNSVTSIDYYAFADCTSLTSVTFKTTSGWYTGSYAGEKTTAISSSDLSNTSTAATYLVTNYYDSYWTRE